jgi:hypothetical protein
MQRRKLIAAVGSLAAGGAATVGTGAFTTVQADRTVEVEVAGDADAYLRLAATGSPNSDAYVSTDDGQVSFDFSSDGGGEGSGFNLDSVTVIDSLLQVANQGAQSVYFHADLSGLDLSDDNTAQSGGEGRAYVALEPVALGADGTRTGTVTDGGSPVTNVAVGGGGGDIDGTFSGVTPGDPATVELDKGEAIELDMIVDTREFTPPSSASFPQTTSGDVTFIADQTEEL